MRPTATIAASASIGRADEVRVDGAAQIGGDRVQPRIGPAIGRAEALPARHARRSTTRWAALAAARKLATLTVVGQFVTHSQADVLTKARLWADRRARRARAVHAGRALPVPARPATPPPSRWLPGPVVKTAGRHDRRTAWGGSRAKWRWLREREADRRRRGRGAGTRGRGGVLHRPRRRGGRGYRCSIRAAGGQAAARLSTCATVSAVDAAVAAVVREFGRLDIVLEIGRGQSTGAISSRSMPRPGTALSRST